MRKIVYIVLSIGLFLKMTMPTLALESNKEELELHSESVVLIDATTGVVLYSKDPFISMQPASITKIMTVYLALEYLELEDVLVASSTAIDNIDRQSSHIYLTYDEKITMENAAYATMLASANDAANVLAESVSGSQEAFATLMTDTAYQAQAMNTNFMNAHGLGDESHYTSAYDMAMITRMALQNEEFRTIFESATYAMEPTNKQDEVRYFASGTELIKKGEFYYEYALGGKTGWTEDAGYTLVATAKKEDLELIAVVLNSDSVEDRYEDVVTLFEYGFENYQAHTIAAADFEQQTKQYLSGSHVEADITFSQKEDLMMLLESDENSDALYFNYIYENEDNKDEVLCFVEIYVGANLLATIELDKEVVEYDVSFSATTLPIIIEVINILCAAICLFFMSSMIVLFMVKKRK